MPILTNISIKQILDEEGKAFISQVRQNLDDKNITKSGKTAASLREESTENVLSIFGRSDFETVEQGISPQTAQKTPFDVAQRNIFEWSKYLWTPFTNEEARRNFSFMVAGRIMFEGSELYRNGGRKDIYTPEIDKMIENIGNRVQKQIISQRFV